MSKLPPWWHRKRSRLFGLWLLPWLVVGVGGQTKPAIAHGVVMQYQATQQIAVQATYDTGEPLANAQVVIYAPDSDTPWQTGKTNEKGQFAFTPEANKAGNWQVKVRLAGHGEVLNVPIQAANSDSAPADQRSLATASATTGYTPLQKGVMAVSVIWGCIGTALFCLRRKA